MKQNKANKPHKGFRRVAKAAVLLNDAIAGEQAKIIARLKQENEDLRKDNVHFQELYYAIEDRLKGEKLQRDYFKRCLEEKKEVIATLNKEIAYQNKRREKAEGILALVSRAHCVILPKK